MFHVEVEQLWPPLPLPISLPVHAVPGWYRLSRAGIVVAPMFLELAALLGLLLQLLPWLWPPLPLPISRAVPSVPAFLLVLAFP